MFTSNACLRRHAKHLCALAAVVLLNNYLTAQRIPHPAPAGPSDNSKIPWTYNITVDGYVVPNDQSYVDPIFSADRKWLHLEARYNYENLRTGSAWMGYNFHAGKTLGLNITPMLGVVFGRTDGIAPGCEASLTYKKVELSISNEYVFDLSGESGSFYFSWPQLTYSPVEWFRVGAVAQHTKAYRTDLSIQSGFLIGFSHKKWEFTTYVLNPFIADSVVVLELGFSF
ncbi:MAG TPA: hypothetical protein VFL42_07435 [Terriglobales bacterium]|nr:hypothetical protein [Terriglobales bacterium]